jgi:hypothetical protein
MRDRLPSPRRRRLLGLGTGLPLLALAGRTTAATFADVSPAPTDTPFSEGATILVAGPDGGAIDQWARLVQPALARSLALGVALRRTASGGADGVTGANRFDARVPPDGRTVLMAPGETVLAWLVGDPRAKFDVGHWLSVMAGVTPGLVVGTAANFAAGGSVRVAASHPLGPDLCALLGIELGGARAVPVAGIDNREALQTAFGQHAVDAVLLRGHKVPDQVKALAAMDVRPIFSLGTWDPSGRLTRPAQFPDIPTLAEFCAARNGAPPGGPIFEAWCASAAASQMEFALVLPQLTPAATVALWRRAGVETADALDVQSVALPLAVHPLGGPAAIAGTAPVAAKQAALLALRKWLAERLDWRPATMPS